MTRNFMKTDFKIKKTKKPRTDLGQLYQFTRKKVFLFSSGLSRNQSTVSKAKKALQNTKQNQIALYRRWKNCTSS